MHCEPHQARICTRTIRPGSAIGILRTVMIGLFTAPCAGGENGPTWQVSSSVNYSSGDYGTDTTTTSLYIPLTVKRVFEDGSLLLTIPYISIESDGSVTFIGGEPHRQKRRQRGKGSGVSGGDRDKDGDGDVDDDDQIPGIRAARTTESGLADIILSGRYFVFDEGD